MALAVVAGAGVGLALYSLLSDSGGTKQTITANVISSMTVNAITSSETNCFLSVSGAQQVDINQTSSAFIESNIQAACANCINRLQTILTARNRLEYAANAANSSYTPQVANSNLLTAMITGFQPPSSGSVPSPTVSAVGGTVHSLGPCDLLCHDVVVMNAVQNLTVKAANTCNVTNNVTTDIQQSLTAQMSSYLKNQQDIIGQLESIFTGSSQKSAANLSNAMVQNVNTNFVQDLHQSVEANQSLRVRGHSIVASNLNQSFNGSMIGTLTVTNTVVDQLSQSADFSITQAVLNSNDTIGTIANSFSGVIEAMADLIKTLTTQVLLIIGAVLAALVMVMGALYVFNKDFKSLTDKSLDLQIREGFHQFDRRVAKH
jgi:hypothetical protein